MDLAIENNSQWNNRTRGCPWEESLGNGSRSREKTSVSFVVKTGGDSFRVMSSPRYIGSVLSPGKQTISLVTLLLGEYNN